MNALIMALVVWLMMKEMSFDGDYMVANITAYLIAQIHNFIWCKYWIFPVENKKNSIWKQILLFCSAFAVAYTNEKANVSRTIPEVHEFSDCTFWTKSLL